MTIQQTAKKLGNKYYFFSSFNKYKPLYVCIISCFRISVISNDCGFIEPVLNTVSLHQVKFFMILKLQLYKG